MFKRSFHSLLATWLAGLIALLPLTQDVPRQQSAYGVVSRAGHSLSPAAQVLLAALREEDRAFRQAAP